MDIKVLRNILEANDQVADRNREQLASKKITTINIISAPGAGKTSLLEKTIPQLSPHFRIGVLEGDIATTRDADRIAKLDVPVIQLLTGGACHLEAALVQRGLGELNLDALDLVLIENVGNIACPAEFDLGENAKVGILSVTEGHDKPGKYPLLFHEVSALVLNKVDAVKRDTLLGLALQLNAEDIFDHVFMISALTGDGTKDVEAWVVSQLPIGPWLYPEDQITDVPQRQLAAEITREQLYLQLHDELPYQATVETERWEERADGSARLDQIIYVQRPSQKAIVLGKGGQQAKKIGARSRLELERVFERRIHLFLFVKVREGWVDDRERYDAIGLDFNA